MVRAVTGVADASDRLALTLVGEFTVVHDGQPIPAAQLGSRKARMLLKFLAVDRGRLIPVDRLVEVVWPDGPPARPVQSVATLVSRLRSVLGPAAIVGGRDGYRLGPHATVDLDRAAALVREAERGLAAEPGTTAAPAAQALELLGGGVALADDPYADWAQPARVEAQGLLRRARHAAAQGALDRGDPAAAIAWAKQAVDDDAVDEPAYRLLMRAYQAAGEPARALAAFERLRQTLAAELGADPAPATSDLHREILRGGQQVAARPARRGQGLAFDADQLAGRAADLAWIARVWESASAGRSRLLLIAGESGIGKTVLAACAADAAARAGATVLRARCYEAERSLFLQPFADLLGPHTTAASVAAPSAEPELQRRLVFESVAGSLRALARPAPLLIFLDDLHSTGMSSVEFLHYLLRALATSPVLVLATIRVDEGAAALQLLADVAVRLDLGPLPDTAVQQLAAQAGRPELGDQILRQTRGHALYVVETLRGLTSGEAGIPPSLREAVLARVHRAGPAVTELLRTAAVVGATLDLAVLSHMLGLDPSDVARRCEDALAARLLTVADREYEFANDLIREVLYASTPVPARVVHHRRAAELLADRPEAVAEHAAAAGDWARAARAYLVASELAAERFANEDAHALLELAMAAATRTRSTGPGRSAEPADRELAGRIHMARGRVRHRLRRYGEARTDFRKATRAAQEAGDQRLEMAALAELAGDVSVALGQPVDALPEPLHRALRIAERLGDRGAEAQLLSRLAVLAANQLRLAEAVELGRRAVSAGRQAADERALVHGLDGLKTALHFLGEAGELVAVIAEMEPLLRRRADLYYLQWTVLESAIIPASAGDWDAALHRIDQALDINRRSGYRAHEPWFLAHAARVHRWRGDRDAAIEAARHAVALVDESPHPWWLPTTYAELARAQVDRGDIGDAVALLQRGRSAVGPRGARAHLLAVTAPLAEATESAELLAEVDALLDAIDTPGGGAWLHGTAAYLAAARAHLSGGAPSRSRQILAPVLQAAARVPSVPEHAEALLVDGTAAVALGDIEAADILRRALALAEENLMPDTAAAVRATLPRRPAQSGT